MRKVFNERTGSLVNKLRDCLGSQPIYTLIFVQMVMIAAIFGKQRKEQLLCFVEGQAIQLECILNINYFVANIICGFN